jgi:hypothetical protein
MSSAKPVATLTTADLEAHPVWRFVRGDSRSEDRVRPVRRLPVSKLAGKLVASELQLASGTRVWGLLGNIDLANPELTAHFVSLSVLHAGRWFYLARYHDPGWVEHGPTALSSFLGSAVPQVFPLSYDISRWCIGLAEVTRGKITAEPPRRLSRAELIALAVP